MADNISQFTMMDMILWGVQRRLGKQFVRFGVQEGNGLLGCGSCRAVGLLEQAVNDWGVWCRWVTGVPTSGWGRIGVRAVVDVVGAGRSVV